MQNAPGLATEGVHFLQDAVRSPMQVPTRGLSAMTIISPCRHSNKPMVLASICAYCDTLEMFTRQKPEPGVMVALHDATGRRVWYEKIKDFGYRTIINQPTIEAIYVLQRWFDECRGASVCRTHIALDFDPRPGCADLVVDLVENNTHLRFRRDADQTYQSGETRYSIKTAGRHTRPSKQTAFYRTRMGKLDGECEKIHFEVRLEKKRAVKAAGIVRPINLLTLNPRQFVQQQLKIADHKPILEKITQRYVNNMIRDTPNPHCDIAKRVAEAFRRMGTDTLTGFKREFPRQFERLASWPLETLNIGNALEWVGGNVGELSPLSPTPRKRQRIRLRIADHEGE
jgi:hypothetical protein